MILWDPEILKYAKEDFFLKKERKTLIMTVHEC